MNRVASPRRALYGGILLSFMLLWCTALGPLPARAAADPAVERLPACEPASTAPDCVPVCNAPQQGVAKEPAPPPSASVTVAAAHSALLEWATTAAPLRPARAPLAGPPLYLTLHRFLK